MESVSLGKNLMSADGTSSSFSSVGGLPNDPESMGMRRIRGKAGLISSNSSSGCFKAELTN